MKRGEHFIKVENCRNKHSSPISISAWCVLNNKGDILKLHVICHKPKGKRQKQSTFKTRQFQLESAGFGE